MLTVLSVISSLMTASMGADSDRYSESVSGNVFGAKRTIQLDLNFCKENWDISDRFQWAACTMPIEGESNDQYLKAGDHVWSDTPGVPSYFRVSGALGKAYYVIDDRSVSLFYEDRECDRAACVDFENFAKPAFEKLFARFFPDQSFSFINLVGLAQGEVFKPQIPISPKRSLMFQDHLVGPIEARERNVTLSLDRCASKWKTLGQNGSRASCVIPVAQNTVPIADLIAEPKHAHQEIPNGPMLEFFGDQTEYSIYCSSKEPQKCADFRLIRPRVKQFLADTLKNRALRYSVNTAVVKPLAKLTSRYRDVVLGDLVVTKRSFSLSSQECKNRWKLGAEPQGDPFGHCSFESPRRSIGPVNVLLSDYSKEWGSDDGLAIIQPTDMTGVGYSFRFMANEDLSFESAHPAVEGLIQDLNGVYSMNFLNARKSQRKAK